MNAFWRRELEPFKKIPMIYRWTLAFLVLFTLGLSIVTTDPDQLIWSETFESSGTKWKTSNSVDELYLIQNGRYILHRKNQGGPAIILPEDGDLYEESHVEMKLSLDELEPGSSMGLVVMARTDGTSAYILEINDNREYRVRKIEESVFKELSGTVKGSGWEKEKAIGKAGETNLLSATCQEGVLKFKINGKDLWISDEFQMEPGKVGIYVGPGSKGWVDEIKVFVDAEEAKRIRKERDEKDPARSELTNIIVSLRKTINAQNKEIDSLKKVSSKLEAEQIKLEKDPRNLKKLNARITALEQENKALTTKIATLTAENTKLKKFKEAIEKGKGGDIVIQLSDALEAERDKSGALERENKDLKTRIAALELELKTYQDDE